MFNKYVSEDINKKFSDLFQISGIFFVFSIYIISIYYFISFFSDTILIYSDEFLSFISIINFALFLFYSIKVIRKKKIKSFKRVSDAPIRNYFISFGVFYFILTFLRILKITLYRSDFIDCLSMETYIIDRAYPYIFVILGLFMALKYMKKKINKLLLFLGFSLIMLQIIFRSIASQSFFMPNEVNETIIMDFIIWGGVYMYTGVIFFLRFNFKRLSLKNNIAYKK